MLLQGEQMLKMTSISLKLVKVVILSENSDEVITTDYISTDAKYYYIDCSNWFWYINH